MLETEVLERIREADERTQIIFDMTPIGCCMFDKNFNIFDCNQEMVNMFGLPNKQMFLEMFFDFSPECQPCGKNSREMLAEQNNRTFRDGRNSFEWMHQRLNGEQMPCEITQVRVKYRGEYVIAGYIMDLREHNALLEKIHQENERTVMIVKERAEAEAASKAKTFFLSTMSHEMRTPMNAIMGMAVIGGNAADIERKNYALNRIEEASRYLLNVINDVLDMSKIEANKLELSYALFELKNSLQKAISFVQFSLEEKGLRFSLNLDDNAPSFFIGDDQRLTQAITNLLSNAVKFTPKEGSIELNVSVAGEENGICELRFEVADSGIGISGEQQKRIFNPYEQAESSTSRIFGGTGLGLVITKRIIELMDGIIWVESEPGKGARFIFTVKLYRDDQGLHFFHLHSGSDGKDKVSVEDIYSRFRGKKVLLVDDIDINREIIISLLQGTGLVIDTAGDGNDALDMVTADPDKYDLIFMDMQMPVMDGLEATRRIRSMAPGRNRRLPIIALTANVLQDDIESCYLAGMDDHVGEPLEIATVLKKLWEYLA